MNEEAGSKCKVKHIEKSLEQPCVIYIVTMETPIQVLLGLDAA